MFNVYNWLLVKTDLIISLYQDEVSNYCKPVAHSSSVHIHKLKKYEENFSITEKCEYSNKSLKNYGNWESLLLTLSPNWITQIDKEFDFQSVKISPFSSKWTSWDLIYKKLFYFSGLTLYVLTKLMSNIDPFRYKFSTILFSIFYIDEFMRSSIGFSSNVFLY